MAGVARIVGLKSMLVLSGLIQPMRRGCSALTVSVGARSNGRRRTKASFGPSSEPTAFSIDQFFRDQWHNQPHSIALNGPSSRYSHQVTAQGRVQGGRSDQAERSTGLRGLKVCSQGVHPANRALLHGELLQSEVPARPRRTAAGQRTGARCHGGGSFDLHAEAARRRLVEVSAVSNVAGAG